MRQRPGKSTQLASGPAEAVGGRDARARTTRRTARPIPILRWSPPVLVLALALAFMANESLLATGIVLADGSVAALVWVAAIGLGWWAITLMRLTDLPLRWQILLAAGLGIGLLALIVLLLGSLGVLGRLFWLALLGLMVLACITRAGLHVYWNPRSPNSSDARSASATDVSQVQSEHHAFRWRPAHALWLPAAGFLVIAMLEATIPAGLNWGDEAGGYDVLEYHFGGPKEYWLAGRIVPLPHNIYTYFPSNAEMLYLLAFVIKDSPFDGIYLAQLLNASLALWAVAAAWLAGRELGAVPGILAGALAATCPWLTYLSGVAYVENGMLFFTLLAMATAVRVLGDPESRTASWFLTAGLLAGLACGFKYTAVPMVALPLTGLMVAVGVFGSRTTTGPCPRGGKRVSTWRKAPPISARSKSDSPPVNPPPTRGEAANSPSPTAETSTLGLITMQESRLRSVILPLLFVVGVAITFSPWLTRNFRIAGNPVFPLAHRTLGYHAGLWNETLARRWDQAHAPAASERSLPSRFARLWDRIVVEPNYGPTIFVIALLGLPAILGSSRGIAVACLVVLVVQVVCWAGATHLFARFGIPMIAPLVVLGAAGWICPYGARWKSFHHALVVGALCIGSTVNLVHVGRLYYHHTRDADGQRLNWFGAGTERARVEPVNGFTPDKGSTVWMVGEARAFYVARPCFYHVVFSRNPLAEFAATQPTGQQLLEWFRRWGVTHVYVNWAEIARFRRPGNYGWHETINEALFESMRAAGAIVTHAERNARTGEPYYEILEVPAG